MNNWVATVYKPCEKKCKDCEPCRVFEKILREIDLKRTSSLQRQRAAEAERRSR